MKLPSFSCAGAGAAAASLARMASMKLPSLEKAGLGGAKPLALRSASFGVFFSAPLLKLWMLPSSEPRGAPPVGDGTDTGAGSRGAAIAGAAGGGGGPRPIGGAGGAGGPP